MMQAGKRRLVGEEVTVTIEIGAEIRWKTVVDRPQMQLRKRPIADSDPIAYARQDRFGIFELGREVPAIRSRLNLFLNGSNTAEIGKVPSRVADRPAAQQSPRLAPGRYRPKNIANRRWVRAFDVAQMLHAEISGFH
ncbi:MAG: hypothetical protein ABSE67_03555 [Xanthobacteraceae bacterium]